jgi:hypothetical protein
MWCVSSADARVSEKSLSYSAAKNRLFARALATCCQRQSPFVAPALACCISSVAGGMVPSTQTFWLVAHFCGFFISCYETPTVGGTVKWADARGVRAAQWPTSDEASGGELVQVICAHDLSSDEQGSAWLHVAPPSRIALPHDEALYGSHSIHRAVCLHVRSLDRSTLLYALPVRSIPFLTIAELPTLSLTFLHLSRVVPWRCHTFFYSELGDIPCKPPSFITLPTENISSDLEDIYFCIV